MPATTRANFSAPTNPPAPGETSLVALGVSFTPSMQWFTNKMDMLFAIARQKAEQELQVVTAMVRCDKEESAAIIAAICAPANAVAPTGPTRPAGEEEKTFLSEISSIILSVVGRYPGLPKAKIARIHENRFKPENLYKFRHLKSCEDKNRNENITFEHGQMKIMKVTGNFRDFGNTIEIWSDGFLNYAMVMVDFFGVAFPSLFRSLFMFYCKVRHLSIIYDW